MPKRTHKYLRRILSITGAAVLLLSVAIYLPGIQELARRAIERYATRTLGMELTIGRLRLAFPLRLSAARAGVVEQGDTLLFIDRLTAEASPWSLLRGEIGLRRLELDDGSLRYRDTVSGLEIRTTLDTLRIDNGSIALRARRIDIGSLRIALGSLSLTSHPSAAPPPKRHEPDTAAPWHLRIARTQLSGRQISYGAGGHHPTRGFDPRSVAIDRFEATIDSLRSHGPRFALRLRRLTLSERSGLTIETMYGGIASDSTTRTDLYVATPRSSLRADLQAGAGIATLSATTPLTADLTADLSMRDVARLFPPAGQPALSDKRLGIDFHGEGSAADTARLRLGVRSPGALVLTAEGRVHALRDPAQSDFDLRIDGTLEQTALLLALLPERNIRHRVTLPDRLVLQGGLRRTAGGITAQGRCTVGTGKLSIDGAFDPSQEAYRLAVRCDSLPLDRILPADSLGKADLRIEAHGRGFDPWQEVTQAAVAIDLARLEYRNRQLGNTVCEATLARHRLSGGIRADNDLLRATCRLDGRLTETGQQLSLAGRLASLDLTPFVPASEPLGGSLLIEASAARTDSTGLTACIALDSILLRTGAGERGIRPTSLTFASGGSGTRSELRSGDLDLRFASRHPFDSLIGRFTRCSDTIRRTFTRQGLDMERLQPLLPDFRLSATAGPQNLLNSLLRTRNYAFDALELHASNEAPSPVTLRLHLDGVQSGPLRLDTLSFGCAAHGSDLDYGLRLIRIPPQSDSIARTTLSGRVGGRTLHIRIRRQAADETPLRMELAAAWSDSSVTARILPDLGSWHVNADNRIAYGPGGVLSANLELTRGDQRLALHATPGDDRSDSIRLDIAGLDIARTLHPLPAAPPVGGTLSVHAALRHAPDSLRLHASATALGTTYEGRHLGDIGITASYAQGSDRQASARLDLDSTELLTLRLLDDGSNEGKDPLKGECTITALPLQRLDPFLPEQLLRLAGTLHGRIRMYGRADAPRFDGYIGTSQAALTVPMAGSTFRLDDDTLRLEGPRLECDSLTLRAPNGSPLTVDGSLRLTPFSAMTADLRLRAEDFQFLNVARKARTDLYGTGFLNLNASVQGPLDALSIRGTLGLLRGTEFTYVMPSSPAEIRQESQDVVTFVSFRNGEASPLPLPAAPPVRVGGMDLRLDIGIDEQVKAGLLLSVGGEERIDLRGGGNLAFALNPLGDISLSGKYLLTGGSLRYKPPLIAPKVFAIRPGSYVAWTGAPADPHFDITATETVRASVSTDGGESRPVNFDLSVTVRNTPDKLAVSLGLAAPEDLAMQNQLQSLTEQQRAQQAMNLLLYNTYTGPGTTGKASTENPLNTFIQKELNQWAQNSLRGVDLSFGIASYDGNDPNGPHTDYSYRISKSLFGDRFRMIVGGKFSTDTDASENLRQNMIDDISLEYLLTKRGNMLLRLFRHTGYENILEGEITETGVGFLLRKKMARLLDLFRSPARIEKRRQRDEARPK